MKIDNQQYTGVFLYKAGVRYAAGDIVIHSEGGVNVLYRVLAETSEEPSPSSLYYEEYAYGEAIKDVGAYDNESHGGKLVSCDVVDAVVARATGELATSGMVEKIAKLQTIQAYESISYSLDGFATDRVDTPSSSSFKIDVSDVSAAGITELDVFVTYAPFGSSAQSGHVYMQEMLRFVLTDRANVYLRDYEDLSCSISKSGTVYTVTITPQAGSVESGTLRVERIEGVGTIISTDDV